MRIKKYSSDLSTKSWQFIEKIIDVQRKSKWDLQEIVNGIFYTLKNGNVWRDLPGEFPPWETVYWYYRKWVKNGTWESINQNLIVEIRQKAFKKPTPSVVIVDSQSVKNTSTSTENIGIDGGKLIKGRKRFFFVDTLGNLIESFVVSANCYDGTTAAKKWGTIQMNNILVENVEKIYADGTFGGTFKEDMCKKYSIVVEIPKIPIAQKGNIEIHPKRWIVERTIAWTNNNRRCSKDYERRTENADAFLKIANIRRLAKRI